MPKIYLRIYNRISLRLGKLPQLTLHLKRTIFQSAFRIQIDLNSLQSSYTLRAKLSPMYTTMCTKFDCKYDLGILRKR